MAREIGHARLECTVLCNLGLVREAQGELDAASDHYEMSVALAHELGDRRSEGQFRGYWGQLLARQGRYAQARACLASGEALLLESSDLLSLGLLLCGRAETEQLAGDASAAQGWWQRAQTVAAQVGVGDTSELGRSMLRVKELLGEPSAH